MEEAVLHHQETHWHGEAGDIVVRPRAQVRLERGARYLADFSLLQGYDRDEGKNCTYPPQTVVLQQKILAPAAPG